MLTKQHCHILNTAHNDYVGFGVSPTDASRGVIHGRPSGGVGFMWKRSIDRYITVLDSEFDWLCGVRISSQNREHYLLNVYLPYESDDNLDKFIDCMAKIATCQQYRQHLYYYYW